MSAAPALVTSSQSRDIVTASLGHLARLVLPGGRFIYAHEAGDIGQTHEGYNLLRHCGTLWFMARAATFAGPSHDQATLDAITRATSFLDRKLEPASWAMPGQPSLAMVGNGFVKLGGVGLALLALSDLRTMVQAQVLAPPPLRLDLDETITQVRRYALDEIDGEDFRHKRVFATGEVTSFRSDYYTGEAIFGLLMSGEPDDELVRVTNSLMRRSYGWAQQSHWMAYAACEAAERGLVPKTLATTYLTGLMEAILADPLYRFRRQSVPIACRTEALTRALLLARKLPDVLSADLLQRVRIAAAENLALQLEWYSEGQFWKGDDSRRVQIDYVQHNATAFLQWAELEA